MKHKMKKNMKKLWQCRQCQKSFLTRKSLFAHRKEHKIEKAQRELEDPPTFSYDEEQEVFVCGVCSAEFQNKDEVETHIKQNHIETYTCNVCSKKFTKAYKFSCHMFEHSDDKLFKCPFHECSYSTARRTCLLTHINRMHYHKFYYHCKTCGKGFMDSVIFKEHENEHLNIRPFVCVVCKKNFTYSRYLLLHQIRYHTVNIEGQYHKTQCTICSKVFAKEETLQKHLNIHKNCNNGAPREKRHLCDVCGKGFSKTDKLNVHYRVHTGIKPYSCSYCDKSFTKKDYLIMHERVHTGEKPYSCNYCGKCFNQGAPLRIHIRSHTGERPYICAFCNSGFVSKGSLTTHLKSCKG